MIAQSQRRKVKKEIKALALFSGGLDSTLATKIVMDQGVHVEALHYVNAFLAGYKEDLRRESYPAQVRIARAIGVKLHLKDISKTHLTMVQKPRYGYGRNLNPCIDCRIFMLQCAKVYMQRNGFSFIISGEVLGQRPMSQRRGAINVIDRDAACQGLVLRPLSAKLLKQTVAEEEGWVQRDMLYAFSGRSRKAQLTLARQLGVKEYLTPAGGCLLTEAEFVKRFKQLSALKEVTPDDVQLLKLGRHFYYKGQVEIIVGRDEQENKHLEERAADGDVLLKLRDVTGPITVIRKDGMQLCEEIIEIAAQITAHYSKAKDQEKVWAEYWSKAQQKAKSIVVVPAHKELIKKISDTERGIL